MRTARTSAARCRCGSALARDNADRLCATCQARRRRDRAPSVPPEFWQNEALADALASGDVGRVIRAYRCHPFHGERLPQTRGVLDTVRRELGLIADHRRVARGDLRSELIGVEARWSWMASWLGRDAGDERIADGCADRARRLAHDAAYPDMAAYVLMRQSLWATPDPRKAIMLADAGGHVRGASAYIRALCALRLAHGHALAGDLASCERSLADAHRLLPTDHVVTDAPLTPWEGLGSREATTPYVLAEEARCWLLL